MSGKKRHPGGRTEQKTAAGLGTTVVNRMLKRWDTWVAELDPVCIQCGKRHTITQTVLVGHRRFCTACLYLPTSSVKRDESVRNRTADFRGALGRPAFGAEVSKIAGKYPSPQSFGAERSAGLHISGAAGSADRYP